MNKLSIILNCLWIVCGIYLMNTNDFLAGMFAILIGFQSFACDHFEKQAKYWEERYWKEFYKKY